MDTTIQSLKLVPEDIEDFLMNYQKEFNVNMDAFIYTDYFEEDVPIVYFLIIWIGKIFNRTKKVDRKTEITIRHLLNVAEKGQWFKPLQEKFSNFDA